MTRQRTIAACHADAFKLPRVTARVDMAAAERLAREASEYLATLSPKRRAELEREWDA